MRNKLSSWSFGITITAILFSYWFQSYPILIIAIIVVLVSSIFAIKSLRQIKVSKEKGKDLSIFVIVIASLLVISMLWGLFG